MFRRSLPNPANNQYGWKTIALIVLLIGLAIFYFFYVRNKNRNDDNTNGVNNGGVGVGNGSSVDISVSPCVGNIANNTYYANPAIAAGLDPNKLCIRPSVLNSPDAINPVRGPETGYYQWFYDGKPTCVGGWGVANQPCPDHIVCADDLMSRAEGIGAIDYSTFGTVDQQMQAVAKVVNGELPGGGNPYCPMVYTVTP